MAVTNEMITRDLGPVSAYALAVAEGFVGTKAQWESYIANAGLNAQAANNSALTAEGYATGKQNGIDISDPTSEFYENNAKYWAEQAADSASSVSVAEVSDVLTYLGI